MTKFYKMARYVFFMASTVKKWTNFSKLAFKWPFWQPWCQPAQNTFKQRLRIHSITHCDITIQNVTHRVDWFSCLTFVLLLMYASTTTKSYILNYMCMAANFIIEGRMQTYGLYFKLHVHGCKFHHRRPHANIRPQVVCPCFRL